MGSAIYDVFWARMDYLLGKRADWITCAVANDRVKKKLVWDANDALCSAINMADRHPEQPADQPCEGQKVIGMANVSTACSGGQKR
jgi:hypothetical protein